MPRTKQKTENPEPLIPKTSHKTGAVLFLFFDAAINILGVVFVFAHSGTLATSQEKDALFVLSVVGVVALFFIREYAKTLYVVADDAITIHSWFQTRRVPLNTLVNVSHQTTTRIYGITIPVMKGGGHIILETKTGQRIALQEVCDSDRVIEELRRRIKPLSETEPKPKRARKQ